MRITAAEGVRAAVLADAGLAVASEWMFAPELETGAVHAVLNQWTLSLMTLWAMHCERSRPSNILLRRPPRSCVD